MQKHRINVMTKIFGAHADELNPIEWLDMTMKIVNGSGFIQIVLVLNNENCKWKWFHFDCVGIKQ